MKYFGLYMETQLMLGEGEAPGWYELAVLSDDGATVSQKNADGTQTTLVDNDGDHPTRMGCGSHAVYMNSTTKLPVVIQYYQGPRYHISMVAMWRPLPIGHDPAQPVDDSECGQSGNERYFDPNTTGSPPTNTYYDMLTRGWKPLANENYFFTQAANATNPCAQENPLLISNFSISSTPTTVTATWVTSIPSTTQLRLKNTVSGVTTFSSVNPTLVTTHSLVMTGLTANTLYAIAGLSVSAGGQSVSADDRAFRTPR
ncbi:MAG: fibronectin type III domain-containing protein [Hyphomonadaceae bacterium]